MNIIHHKNSVRIIAAVIAVGIPTAAWANSRTSVANARPHVLAAQSRVMLARATAAGGATLSVAPTSDGRVCQILHIAGYVADARADNGGEICGNPAPQPVPITTTMAWIPTGNGYSLIVYGRVADTVSSLQLVAANGTFAVPVHNGYYLTTLPAPRSNALSGGAVLQAAATDGSVVGTLDLQQVIDRSTPPS